MPSSTMWRPERRSRTTIGGVTLTYLAGDTEGAYQLEADQTVTIYPARNLTTAMRRKIINEQLEDPDPLAATVGALVLAGLQPDEFSVDDN